MPGKLYITCHVKVIEYVQAYFLVHQYKLLKDFNLSANIRHNLSPAQFTGSI